MRLPSQLPELVFVRVLTAGGPYAVGDTLSLAFVSPLVGRLAAHVPRGEHRGAQGFDSALVPESISVVVECLGMAYAEGDELTLSFVDPTVVRIHSRNREAMSADTGYVAERGGRPAAAAPPCDFEVEHPQDTLQPAISPESIAAYGSRAGDGDASGNDASRGSILDGISLHVRGSDAPSRAAAQGAGVRVRLHWDSERVRRFIRVVDKLFTVDRLGWYRHALAMRLLVPDEIATGDELSDVEAMRHVHALRAAAVETLGKPLLAALMPNFGITHEWLDALDSAAAARALAGIREAIAPHVCDDEPSLVELDRAWTVGTISREQFLRTPAGSVEALLPILIPGVSSNTQFGDILTGYRQALSDLFGQMAQCPDAVRLNAMSQANHSLDDRLWQLVGAVGDSFGAVTGA